MGEEGAGVNGRSRWYRATVYNAVHARDGTGQPQATEQQQQQQQQHQGTRCPGNDRTFALPPPDICPFITIANIYPLVNSDYSRNHN